MDFDIILGTKNLCSSHFIWVKAWIGSLGSQGIVG